MIITQDIATLSFMKSFGLAIVHTVVHKLHIYYII